MRTIVWVGALAFAGCGGSKAAPDAAVDAKVIADGHETASSHRFVVDRLLLPTRSGQGNVYGTDLDGDGNIDNALANVMAALSSAAGSGTLDLQGDADTAVARGDAILLVDVEASSLDTAANVGLRLFDGANPMPAPCTDPSMLSTCGQHLKGTGTFDVAATSPTDATIAGNLVAGRFVGGPGHAILPLTLFGGTIEVRLVGARAVLGTVTSGSISAGVLDGAITKTDVDQVLIPGMQANMAVQIARDCTGTGVDCGCRSGTAGATHIALFDKAPHDCAVTTDEIRTNDLIKTLLAPDVELEGQPGLSVGVGLTAVPATFPVP